MDVKMGDTIQYSDHISYTFDGEFLTVTFGEENQVRWNGYNGKFRSLRFEKHTYEPK